MKHEMIRLATPRDNDDGVLLEDEWFALMVTDHNPLRPKEDFQNYEKRWIGLERTGDRIYISKNYAKRHSRYRGDTWVVKVNDTSNFCII